MKTLGLMICNTMKKLYKSTYYSQKPVDNDG